MLTYHQSVLWYSSESNFAARAQTTNLCNELESYTCTFNSLCPSDTIRRQETESTLAQVMACCLTAPSHYLNHVDLSSVRYCGIHRRALSWEDLTIPISKTRLKITFLESHSDLSGANELIFLPYLPRANSAACRLMFSCLLQTLQAYLDATSGGRGLQIMEVWKVDRNGEVRHQGLNIKSKLPFNTLRPRQIDHHFGDDIFKCVSLNENLWIFK